MNHIITRAQRLREEMKKLERGHFLDDLWKSFMAIVFVAAIVYFGLHIMDFFLR